MTKSPYRITVPTSEHWYLIIDLGGYAGSVNHSVLVFQGVLPVAKSQLPLAKEPNLYVESSDENGSYSYYLESRNCCENGCTTHHTDKLFTILRKNKFNLKDANKKVCDTGLTIWYGESSYIKAVKWSDFISNYSTYIESACVRQDNIDDYEICKAV